MTPDEQEGLFDVIVFHDMGVDVVLPYTKVSAEGAGDLVYDAVFARSPRSLGDLAFFVGGSSLEDSGNLASEIARVLGELPDKLRVSVAADPSGAYTTGASVVAKVKRVLGSLEGARAVVLAGTGPVGMAAAALLGLGGARVGLSSRMMESAVNACGFIKMKYDVMVEPLEVNDDGSLSHAISDATVVVACGPSGTRILPKSVWEGAGSLRVLADVNAVAPSGIEGVEPDFDGVVVSERVCFGALGLGDLKMRVHRKLVNNLFLERGVVLDLEGIRVLAENLA